MEVTKGEKIFLLKTRKLRKSKCNLCRFLDDHIEGKNGHKIGDKCWIEMDKSINRALKINIKKFAWKFK